MTYEVAIDGRSRQVVVERASGGFLVTIDGRSRAADVTVTDGVWSLILETDAEGGGVRRSYDIAIAEEPPGSGRLIVHVDGRLVPVAVGSPRSHSSRRGQDGAAGGAPNDGAARHVTAPMPGKVVKLLVRPGETVAARQAVVVVEAMKMENELRAPRAGRVAEIKVAEGASVEAGAILAVIE